MLRVVRSLARREVHGAHALARGDVVNDVRGLEQKVVVRMRDDVQRRARGAIRRSARRRRPRLQHQGAAGNDEHDRPPSEETW
jgi:hypothetical protein